MTDEEQIHVDERDEKEQRDVFNAEREEKKTKLQNEIKDRGIDVKDAYDVVVAMQQILKLKKASKSNSKSDEDNVKNALALCIRAVDEWRFAVNSLSFEEHMDELFERMSDASAKARKQDSGDGSRPF